MSYKYGIDFGTTNSSIAIVKPDDTQRLRPSVLQVDPGNSWGPAELLRSIFYVDIEGGIHVGKDAEDTMAKEENAGQYDERRYKTQIKMDLARANEIKISCERFTYDATDLLAALFKRLKQSADTFARNNRMEMVGAVLGVPVSFSEENKRIYLEALCKAGYYNSIQEAMSITEFVSEPAAVAVNYGEKLTSNHRVMVFDYGGGTLDVCVVDLRNQIGRNDRLHPHEVIAQSTGYDIGGERINKEFLLNFFVPKYGFENIKSYLGINSQSITNGESLWNAMKQKYAGILFIQQIERCKQELSSADSAFFVPPAELHTKGRNLRSITVTREDFQESVEGVFQQVDIVVRDCIAQCRSHNPPVYPNQISGVFLAGGSSMIPYAKDILANYILDRSKIGVNTQRRALPSKEVTESIVRGLAIVGYKEQILSDLLDCSYGTWDVRRNCFSEIIPKGTPISTIENDEFNDASGKCKDYEAADPNAKEMTIKIFQRTSGVNNDRDKELKEITIPIGGRDGTDFKFYLSIDKKLKMLILKVYSVSRKTFYIIPREDARVSINL